MKGSIERQNDRQTDIIKLIAAILRTRLKIWKEEK